MIELISKSDAERQGVDPRRIQCITPYLNPGHILSPPRQWLEALVNGDYGWHFFRLRYKNLLRNRYRAEPERFHALLRLSEGNHLLYLTCHCLTNHCHREVAREYLELLRARISDRFAARIPGPDPAYAVPAAVVSSTPASPSPASFMMPSHGTPRFAVGSRG